MKKMKQLFAVLLSVVMLLAAAPTTFAAVSDTGFSDVSADAWYADAVAYVRDNGLMSGTGPATFGPDETMTRAMLATVLYRAAGSPAVTGTDGFSDTSEGAYYANAVLWASENGIVSGYGNGLFGTNDPVSREQLATILWRYAGSPAAEQGDDFADESAIASYAAGAVNWARANGIINGTSGNLFAPKENASRAQVATILRNYMTKNNTNTPDIPAPKGKTLVVYFSATGSTETVAGYIAETLNADLFELVPTAPYTSDDLNWTADGSRVNREHDDPALRTVELTASTLDNWDSYDTVFIGYPVWWGIAAWPVDGFIAANDFSGKTVIPFCTSTSSGLGQSGQLLEQAAGTGNWQEGQRFSSNASEASVRDWVAGLNLNTEPPAEQESRSLVVYFSMPETKNPNNMTTEEANSTVVIGGEVLGNTQYMANVIQETIGADIFRIEPKTPYPTEHSTLVDLASKEKADKARPELLSNVENLQQYDVVFLGYPNWWGDMPMVLYTFLEANDLSGKTIIPFNTHGGSGFSGTTSTIQTLEPNATVLNGLSISRNSIQDAGQEIVDWVKGLKL